MLGAIVLYAFLWRGGPGWGGDTKSYLDAARDLADYRWEQLHFRSPGYPLLLRLTGAEEPGLALVLVQLGLYAAAVYSFASLLARLGAGRGIVIAFTVACWLPHVAQSAGVALSESLATSLLALGFAALARGIWLGGRAASLGAASAAFGALAVTRPVYQATAPFLAAVVALVALLPAARALRPRLLRAAVILPLGTLILAGGLAVYQQRRFEEGASSLGAVALAAQTAAYVEALPPEEPLREILVRHRDAWLVQARHHRPEGYIFRAWPEVLAHFDGDERRAARELMRLNREVIRREPRAYVLQVWRSFARYLEFYSFAVPGLRSSWVEGPLLLVHLATTAAFWALLGAAGVGAAWLWRWPAGAPSRPAMAPGTTAALGTFALAAAAVAAHMALQCALGVGEPRYRLPSEPLVLLAIAAAVSVLLRTREGLARAGPPRT
jgi:hypothetical protein